MFVCIDDMTYVCVCMGICVCIVYRMYLHTDFFFLDVALSCVCNLSVCRYFCMCV